MSPNIQVKCSGALYSSLHCELINKDKVQEGFLLGEIEKFTSRSISDSQINNENANININISGYIPCSTVGGFYSGCGRLNYNYLKHIAGCNLKKIVGWYRSRSFTDSLFLKEMRIHEQLCKEMADNSDCFLFALFSRMKPATSGTMDINYRFQIMLNNNEFEGVSLAVVNMKDTSTSQYIKTASSVLYDSESLQNIIESIKNIEPGVKEAETLHTGLLNQLRTLLPTYASVQEQYRQTLQHVSKLRENCHQLGLKIDFPTNESPDPSFDVMELQSPQAESADSGDSPEIKTKSKNDLFDFVEKEMDKEQENATKKECKSKMENVLQNEINGVKNKKNSKSVKKSLLSSEPPSRLKISVDGTGRVDKDTTDSPIRKTGKNSSAPRTPKSNTADNVISWANSSLKSTSCTPQKQKEKEASTEDNKMCSDSPEF